MRLACYAGFMATTNGCTLFEHDNLQGDYFAVGCGALCPNLAWDDFNDLASSLVVWPR